MTLFAKPRRIESGEEARVYLEQFTEAVASVRPSRDELEHVWQQIRMDSAQKTWPLPGEVCERIQRFRAKQAANERRFDEQYEQAEPEPDPPLTPAERAELEDAIARIPDGPLKATLTRAGEAILAR